MFNPNQPPSGGFSLPQGLLGQGRAMTPGWQPGMGSPFGMNQGGMSAQVMPQHGFGMLPPQANPMAQQNAFGMNPMAQGMPQPHILPPNMGQMPMQGMPTQGMAPSQQQPIMARNLGLGKGY